ncbi:tRNA pseudouridine(55) synthase TruB [Allofustis seminis]|uniref:tRNA pseudouridine(55) synthase TruB n=1 Tax=Allofustis seminis TaxID=166939 RepID=UPI000371F1A9|nr:tRNA pseudouridine(55) synthase TruB [Allofustis seminis]
MDGILPIWKVKGMTSHDVVNKVRHLFHTKKVGHGGTLDPDVEGVLLIAVGASTRALEFILDGNKGYSGEITLGFSTTTEDSSGEIVERKAVGKEVNEASIDQAMQTFIGNVAQTPPLYSAVRVNGKRLYEYARHNIPVERPVRFVDIFSFKRTSDISRPTSDTLCFQFDVSCGKGTYIRTLAVDLGDKLGYPAHMSQLTRTVASHITQAQTLTLEELEKIIQQQGMEAVHQYFIPLKKVLNRFDQVELTDEAFSKVKNGSVLPIDYFGKKTFPLVMTYAQHVAAIYIEHPSRPEWMKPKKVFPQEVE